MPAESKSKPQTSEARQDWEPVFELVDKLQESLSGDDYGVMQNLLVQLGNSLIAPLTTRDAVSPESFLGNESGFEISNDNYFGFEATKISDEQFSKYTVRHSRPTRGTGSLLVIVNDTGNRQCEIVISDLTNRYKIALTWKEEKSTYTMDMSRARFGSVWRRDVE